jgi:hypothetical protein
MRQSNTKKYRGKKSLGEKSRGKKNRGLTFLALLGTAGLACLLAGWSASSSQVPDLSPADVVALRFPDARNDIFNDIGDARAEAVGVMEPDEPQFALFSPYPTMLPSDTAVAPATYVTASIPSAAAEMLPPGAPARDMHAKPEPKVAAVRSKPAAPPRSPGRPGAVLSDGQIASIKARLNLTPDQEEMWPAVEQALRGLAYTKKPDEWNRNSSQAATRTATLDPNSDEVQRLKSAAFPLVMSFSDEQKHELRILAHVAGLERLAAQF